LGYSYYLLGDFDYAERMITRALELDPLSPQVQYHLGVLKASQNQFQSSTAAFEMALLLDPEGEIGELAQRALETISP
jgi:lipoprotein NlpI